MAIFKRVKWQVIENGKVRDIVSFPETYDERKVKNILVTEYKHTGSFQVKRLSEC